MPDISLNRSILLLILVLPSASAQLPARPDGLEDYVPPSLRAETDATSEFIITVWKSGEGLPVNEIEDLEETPDGYLWLGTHQGLVRFDGIRFKSFFSVPTGSRYGTRVGPLEVDGRGRLWYAPDQVGLGYLENSRFVEVLTNAKALSARVVSLCSDGTNNMFWVDATGALGRVPFEKPNEVELLKGGGASGASQWIQSPPGRLWLVNARGLKVFDAGECKDVPMPGNATLVATPRRAGGLWIARDGRLRYATVPGPAHDVAAFPWR